MANDSCGESVIVDTGYGTDTATLTNVLGYANIVCDMGEGNYDHLTLVNCTVVTALTNLQGGGDKGDTLVLVHNHFGNPPTIDGFQYVIG